jgi:hypothetical protein
MKIIHEINVIHGMKLIHGIKIIHGMKRKKFPLPLLLAK